MLNARFLLRLEDAFPHFYERAAADAMEDAQRILRETNGDVEKALLRARMESAGRLWWPYVRGSVPVAKNDIMAMEAFTRLVLTVDHLVGYVPASMDEARAHVTRVLRESLDVARLRDLARAPAAKDSAAGAAAGAGLVASMSALLGPVTVARRLNKWTRFVPFQVKIALGAVIVAALASVPIIAGYSAGRHAEEDARERVAEAGTGATRRANAARAAP